MKTIPRELNWVRELATCTAEKVFNQICDEVARDVEAVNSSYSLPPKLQFQASMSTSGSTLVVGQPQMVPRARVTFGIENGWIVVHEEFRQKQWGVSIGLNDEGRCILRLEDGSELEHWQFRKRALENLFFIEAPKDFLWPR